MEINLIRDLKSILLEQFRNGGFKFNGKLPTHTLARHYFNQRVREIEPRIRRVHFSDQIKIRKLKLSREKAFKQIHLKARAGESLIPYLSEKYADPSAKDALLYDWKIHHLHLGAKVGPRPPFCERTRELLYVRVESDDIYLIDALDHDAVNGFANINLIEIVHRNWPHLLHQYTFATVTGTEHRLTSELMAKVRKVCATAPVTVSDGTVYFPSGGGYASSGDSLWATMTADRLFDLLERQEKVLRENEDSIRRHISERTGSSPKTLRLRLVSWTETGVEAIEKSSGVKVRTNVEASKTGTYDKRILRDTHGDGIIST